MKPIILSLAALGLGALALHSLAQEPADEPEVPYSAPAASSPVADALAKFTTFNGTPAADARYYIYLESASWCPPCRAEMPKIAKAYDEMKANGVEIILIGRDATAEAAQKYLTTFKATFPGIFGAEVDKAGLPGFTSADYVPHAVMVDAQGNVVANGHGSLTLKWQQLIADHEAKQQQQ